MTGPTIAYVVETFLDWDRPALFVDQAWVEQRIRVFERFTQRSLLGQTEQGFRIIVQCGSRNRPVTEAHLWHPRIERAYEKGPELYARIEADFLAVTRIDSDDAFHRDALQAIKRLARPAGRKIGFYAFKQNICWDTLNGFIVPHIRASTPFVTRVYPRRIFRDWAAFETLHFRAHGDGGLGDRRASELPKNMVCVIKHDLNTSEFKRGREHKIMTPAEKAGLVKTRAHRDEWTSWKVAWVLTDPAKMRRALAPFGIPAEEIK